MITNKLAAIKRSDDTSNLDDLFGYSTNDVENTSTIEVVGSGSLPDALKEYDAFLSAREKESDSKLVLSKKELELFLLCSKFQDKYESNQSKSGIFLSRLIKNTYDSNENNFKFEFDFSLITHFCHKIKADENRPLRMYITGDVGQDAFYDCENMNVKVIGDVGHLSAYCSENMNFDISGDTNISFGWRSNNLSAKIGGNGGYRFGFYSKNMRAVIEKDTGTEFGNGSKDLLVLVKGNVRSDKYHRNGVQSLTLDEYYGSELEKEMDKLREVFR
jgi:hypothetical protein